MANSTIQEAIIDDNNVSGTTTFSSLKINEIATKFPDYTRGVIHTGGTWTATEDCYVTLSVVTSTPFTYPMYVNGVDVTNKDSSSVGTSASITLTIFTFNGFVKKGDVLSGNNYYKVWGLRSN